MKLAGSSGLIGIQASAFARVRWCKSGDQPGL